jgi:hypothetical protein
MTELKGNIDTLIKVFATGVTVTVMSIENIDLWLRLIAAVLAVPIGIMTIIKLWKDIKAKS